MRDTCIAHIAQQHKEVIALQSALTSFQALGPDNGGKGEAEKAAFVEEALRKAGVTDFLHSNAPDERVPSGIRPNLVARITGKSPRTLWIFSHLDVVPQGDINLWKHDPWTVQVDGDTLTGRGVEDNQQAIVSSLLTAKALLHHQAIPELSLGLVFLADEETGNAYGLHYLLQEAPELFSPDDLYLVPDAGSPDGAAIEIAEKTLLQLEFSITGTQCHAAMPQQGNNSFTGAATLALLLEKELHEDFPQSNSLFQPPFSTFIPTRHEANVPNINTVPGHDRFFMDCRILPGINADDVLFKINEKCQRVATTRKLNISMRTVHRLDAAQETSPKAPIITLLSKAIHETYALPARTIGIGGNSFASLLRHKGIPVAVWARLCNTCHAPNERALISSAIGDAQVFTRILFTPAL